MQVRSSEHEILIVSQFTLYARLKGNKPDFSQAVLLDKVIGRVWICAEE